MNNIGLFSIFSAFFSVVAANILIEKLFDKPTFLDKSKVSNFILLLFLVLAGLLLHFLYGNLETLKTGELMVELFIFTIIFLGFRKYAYDRFVLGFDRHQIRDFYG